MSVDVLRRAAEKLRDPMLCNFPTKIGLPLADAMDAVAQAVDSNPYETARGGYDEMVAVAQAVLSYWWD